MGVWPRIAAASMVFCLAPSSWADVPTYVINVSGSVIVFDVVPAFDGADPTIEGTRMNADGGEVSRFPMDGTRQIVMNDCTILRIEKRDFSSTRASRVSLMQYGENVLGIRAFVFRSGFRTGQGPCAELTIVENKGGPGPDPGARIKTFKVDGQTRGIILAPAHPGNRQVQRDRPG